MEREYPTIAVSDLFMCLCCLYAARQTYSSRGLSSLGFALIAAACFFGVLRFGLNAKLFARYNENLAKIAGRIGLPCIGLGFARGLAGLQFLPSDLHLLAVLILGFGISMDWSTQKGHPGEVCTSLSALFGMFLAAYYGILTSRWLALVGVALFLVAGLVITPNRQKILGGVRCENWFHYLSGISYLLLVA